MANPDGRSENQGDVWRDEGCDTVGGRNAADIWRVCLDVDELYVRQLQTLLSREERDRGSKYRFDTHRNSFIVRRGILRTVLAEYLGIKPDAVQYRTGDFGKLHLADSTHCLEFNVTHSHTMALIAVTEAGSVGVDLEFVRPLSDFEGLVDTCLSESERCKLDTFPPAERLEYFYRYWTCKEAWLKALGTGLDRSPASIQVSLTVSGTRHEATLQANSHELKDFAVTSFVPSDGYIAAVVAPSYVQLVLKTAGVPK